MQSKKQDKNKIRPSPKKGGQTDGRSADHYTMEPSHDTIYVLIICKLYRINDTENIKYNQH